MKKLLITFGTLLFTLLLSLSPAIVQAENKAFSEAELDQMMAPIALYPDSLLSQILMASSYPANINEAVKWSKANPKQKGDAAVEAVKNKSWDPSVMSLAAFPQVLAMMGEKPDWVRNVGDAFLATPEKVMDTVQKLRNKAKAAGNLETNKQQKVTVEEKPSETIVIIEPADPQVVYVPTYNPTVVYGTWWWPHYSPWFYHPPYGYYGWYGFGGAVMRGIGFGVGVGVTRALWGGCSWGRGHGNVNINVNKFNNINNNRNKISGNGNRSNWKHNSKNRGGTPYRDKTSRDKFSNKRGGADNRQNFRGRDAQRNNARSTLDKRAVNPSKGRQQLKGAGGDRARSSVNQANRQFSQGRLSSQSKNSRNNSTRNNNARNKSSYSNRATNSRNNAFKNSNNGNRSRQNISRGNYSNRSRSSSGGSHRSGGGGRRGGGRGGRR